MFVVVFAIEKFRQYLLGSKVVVYTDQASIKYLMECSILNSDILHASIAKF